MDFDSAQQKTPEDWDKARQRYLERRDWPVDSWWCMQYADGCCKNVLVNVFLSLFSVWYYTHIMLELKGWTKCNKFLLHGIQYNFDISQRQMSYVFVSPLNMYFYLFPVVFLIWNIKYFHLNIFSAAMKVHFTHSLDCAQWKKAFQIHDRTVCWNILLNAGLGENSYEQSWSELKV